MKKLFTSESVTEGHPDKVCDLISDSILDAMMEQDKNSRVACNTCVNCNNVIIIGEVTTNAKVDIPKIVRETIKEIGYSKEEYGFNYKTCNIDVQLKKQSNDIALGVNLSLEDKLGEKFGRGAGDQGMVFGFACDETDEFMPMPIYYAHALAKRLAEVRKNNIIKYLRPDGKTQITIEYENDIPRRIEAIVVSTQHDDNIISEQVKEDITREVIKKVVPSDYIDSDTKIYINPTGRFVIGGPAGDSGLTGRKIIVDTYGGYARHGGGAFSGKDPTKVDRSASYMARYIAKNIVVNKLAKKCEIQISYAIGIAKPVSVNIDTFGTGRISDEQILEIIYNNFDMTPDGMIQTLNLHLPIYKKTTNYGHFGKEYLPWENEIMLPII